MPAGEIIVSWYGPFASREAAAKAVEDCFQQAELNRQNGTNREDRYSELQGLYIVLGCLKLSRLTHIQFKRPFPKKKLRYIGIGNSVAYRIRRKEPAWKFWIKRGYFFDPRIPARDHKALSRISEKGVEIWIGEIEGAPHSRQRNTNPRILRDVETVLIRLLQPLLNISQKKASESWPDIAMNIRMVWREGNGLEISRKKKWQYTCIEFEPAGTEISFMNGHGQRRSRVRKNLRIVPWYIRGWRTLLECVENLRGSKPDK